MATVATNPEPNTPHEPHLKLSTEGNPLQLRLIGSAMHLGPNINPRLGFLAHKPSRLGTLSYTQDTDSPLGGHQAFWTCEKPSNWEKLAPEDIPRIGCPHGHKA